MKIAILGGGFTGLTAAYYLQKKGHDITIYEQNNNLGGLAGLMLQLPLPYYINLDQVLNVINPSVDVDCLTSFCRNEFYNNKPIYTPPTAKAILYIFDSLQNRE
jgi:5,10-methylene-tetrahydrofolate dehydrogenase/methenyl tetrahydrofolate cyclohydrolase